MYILLFYVKQLFWLWFLIYFVTLKLWNIKTCKKLYKFSGWNSPVLCLEPCPAVLDAVAIGLESGQIIVHNIKYDEEYVSFKQVSYTKIFSLNC
jgi:hypothetical protein